MSPLLWLVIAMVLFVIEMLTPGLFFFACFGAGALIASLFAMLGAPQWAAWTIFFVTSLLFILLVAPIARRWMKKTTTVPVGLDSLEGQNAQVIETIDPVTGKGQVRLTNGAIWRAISDQSVTEGSQVKINCIVGARLQVSQNFESPSTKE